LQVIKIYQNENIMSFPANMQRYTCRVVHCGNHPRRCIAFNHLRPVIGQADVTAVVTTGRRIVQNRVPIPDTLVIKFNLLNI
jgi:hypothetical protein